MSACLDQARKNTGWVACSDDRCRQKQTANVGRTWNTPARHAVRLRFGRPRQSAKSTIPNQCAAQPAEASTRTPLLQSPNATRHWTSGVALHRLSDETTPGNASVPGCRTPTLSVNRGCGTFMPAHQAGLEDACGTTLLGSRGNISSFSVASHFFSVTALTSHRLFFCLLGGWLFFSGF